MKTELSEILDDGGPTKVESFTEALKILRDEEKFSCI